MMPKLMVLAARRWSGVTSSGATPKTEGGGGAVDVGAVAEGGDQRLLARDVGGSIERGDLDAVEAALEQSLRVWEEKFGPDHRSLTEPLLGLARIHQARGDAAGAEPLYRGALEIREKALLPDHPQLREAREEYGVHRAWATAPIYPQLREAREEYAEFLHRQERDDEAERLLDAGG